MHKMPQAVYLTSIPDKPNKRLFTTRNQHYLSQQLSTTSDPLPEPILPKPDMVPY